MIWPKKNYVCFILFLIRCLSSDFERFTTKHVLERVWRSTVCQNTLIISIFRPKVLSKAKQIRNFARQRRKEWKKWKTLVYLPFFLPLLTLDCYLHIQCIVLRTTSNHIYLHPSFVYWGYWWILLLQERINTTQGSKLNICRKCQTKTRNQKKTWFISTI